ncbi:hypothetical protein PXO_01829 [Xanthomonas oryzae pv. oryzae PXO99A]|uniref:Uncharacterized protein n=1 Tax=Xanthomonas oryzae pv. oryzae (strain PXO99A) TaxID=360094 RepID=A0A0K0GMI2_XANOP|nr:hypothetical protein PXO_01829 [Xanthomonas oryzae pv. oryzae PXO99A]
MTSRWLALGGTSVYWRLRRLVPIAGLTPFHSTLPMPT